MHLALCLATLMDSKQCPVWEGWKKKIHQVDKKRANDKRARTAVRPWNVAVAKFFIPFHPSFLLSLFFLFVKSGLRRERSVLILVRRVEGRAGLEMGWVSRGSGSVFVADQIQMAMHETERKMSMQFGMGLISRRI